MRGVSCRAVLTTSGQLEHAHSIRRCVKQGIALRHASSSTKRPAPELRRPDGLKTSPQPVQRWSTRTMILLSSAVGASTYMLGANQGYHAGKRAGIEEVELRGANPTSPAQDKSDASAVSPAPATSTPA